MGGAFNGRLVTGAIIAACLSGCGRKTTPSKKSTPGDTGGRAAAGADAAPSKSHSTSFSGPANAVNLLPRMAEVYSRAAAYRDQGVFRIHYSKDGVAQVEELPMAVAFKRPGQLRVRAYTVDLLCAKQRLAARLDDEATRDFDNQQLTDELDSQSPLLPRLERDAILWERLSQEPGGLPLALRMLLSPKSSKVFAQEGLATSLLAAEEVERHPCHKIAVHDGGGRYVLWIDQATYVLRRLEHPVTQRRPEEGVEIQRIVAEFRQAAFAAPDASQFQWAPREGAKLVKRFVPPPAAVSSLLGNTPPDFSFRLPSGDRLKQADLQGNTTVLMWFRESEVCAQALRQLEAVRRSAAAAKAKFIAVSAEGADAGAERLERLLEMWQVGAQLAEDVDACGRDVFQISGLPALVVLDAQGRLHVLDVGYHPHLVQELALVLQMLAEGRDVAEQARLRRRAEEAAYRQELAKAGADNVDIEFPVASRTDPQRVQLTRHVVGQGPSRGQLGGASAQRRRSRNPRAFRL